MPSKENVLDAKLQGVQPEIIGYGDDHSDKTIRLTIKMHQVPDLIQFFKLE